MNAHTQTHTLCGSLRYDRTHTWVSKLESSSHLFIFIFSFISDLHSTQTFGSDTPEIFITLATMGTTAVFGVLWADTQGWSAIASHQIP